MKCPVCGTKQSAVGKFCEKCGEELPPQKKITVTLAAYGLLVGSILILLGYILPWASVNVLGFHGNFSGLTGFFGMIFLLITSLFGAGALASESLAGGVGGGVMVIIVLLMTIFVALVPIMAIKIFKLGMKLVKATGADQETIKLEAKRSSSLALIGGIPLVCYIAFSATFMGSMNFFGMFGFQSLSAGVWITLLGFIVSLLSGLGL